MEFTELFDQNPWWKDKKAIEEDYDIEKWKEKKHRWIPSIAEKINLDSFSFHIITGPRQVGKTTLLKLIIKKQLEERNPRSIFYFNCENLQDNKEVSEVLSNYFDFKESNSIISSLIFLDEITSPKEWYRAIKFLIDKGKFKNDVLIVTGSSSISVKKEVELFPGRRGNGKDFILYPLSFRGFLRVVNPAITDKLPCVSKIADIEKTVINSLVFEKELNKYLIEYMEYGGLPLSAGNLSNKEDAMRVYLTWIKNAILKSDKSDIIARQIIKVLIETLQSNISWEGVSKKLEIKSPKTVAAYVDFLKSIFVLNVLYNLDLSGRKIRFGKNKKIHLRDPLLLDIFEDWCLVKAKNKKSAIAESLVVEHLSRAFPERVFFWKNGFEIDAVVLEKNKSFGFEVKWKEKSADDAKYNKISQLEKVILITKKEYSKNPIKIPLAVFLSVFDV